MCRLQSCKNVNTLTTIAISSELTEVTGDGMWRQIDKEHYLGTLRQQRLVSRVSVTKELLVSG
jgi:hypothetical protein